MSDNKVYQTTIRHFLTKECRIITTDFENCSKEENQWVVLKDIFECLAKSDEDGYYTRKTKEFMESIQWEQDLKKFRVYLGKDSLGRDNIQDPWCIRLTRVPTLVMRHEPKVNTPQFEIWKGYIHYVNDLLLQNQILDKLFIQEQSREEALRQFQNKIFTLAQVASDFKCKNGKDVKELLIQMKLVKMKDDNIIDDYDAKFLNCTNKLVRVKAVNIEELTKLILEYKRENNIEDYVPKQRKSKKYKLRCIQTGKEFPTKVQAADYGNTGTTSINNYLKGLQEYAGKLEDGTRLTWEWVLIED